MIAAGQDAPWIHRYHRLLSWIADSALRSYLVVLAIALVYRLATFEGASLGGYDERIYAMFAQTLGEQGVQGIRALVPRAATDEILSKGPLPLRIGYIAAGTLTCKLLGGYELRNLAWLSFASGLAAVLLGFALLRRWTGPRHAILAALFLIVSPLGTALSRCALQDAFFSFLATGSVLLFDVVWTRPRAWSLALLGALVTAALLTKESAAFLYLCFVGIGLMRLREGDPGHDPEAAPSEARLRRRIGIPLLVAPLLAFLVTLELVGDLRTLLSTYAAYYDRQGKIEYAVQYQRGPWFRYLVDLLLVAPVAYVLSIAGMLAVFSEDTDARRGRRLCAVYALVGFVVLSAAPILNVRFILPLDVPLRGLTLLGILSLAGRFQAPGRRAAALTLGIALALAADVHQFVRLFVTARVYDPVTQTLVIAEGFMNPPPRRAAPAAPPTSETRPAPTSIPTIIERGAPPTTVPVPSPSPVETIERTR